MYCVRHPVVIGQHSSDRNSLVSSQSGNSPKSEPLLQNAPSMSDDMFNEVRYIYQYKIMLPVELKVQFRTNYLLIQHGGKF